METETITKKWLNNEVKFVVAVIAFVWGIAIPYFGIKQDIALIKENHFVHIESMEKEQTRLSNVQTKQQEEIIALMTAIAKIEK
jgi:hypothetical protein